MLFTEAVLKGKLTWILKASKEVHEVMFFNMYKYSEGLFSTLYLEIKHKC